MVYNLRFCSSKCSLFHNSNVFGPCIIHILYTGCAKIKKKIGVKRYWLGHVERMAEDNIVRKIKRWKPMSERPIGRPNTRWEDDCPKWLANSKRQPCFYPPKSHAQEDTQNLQKQ